MAQNTLRKPVAVKPRDRQPAPSKPVEQMSLPFKKKTTDPRNYKFWGGVLMIIAICLFFAFLSYIFTGAADHSIVESVLQKRHSVTADEVQNKLGLWGAIFSHFFIFRWFGVAATGFPILLFLIGFKLSFEKEIIPLKRTTELALFYTLWLSLFFGLVIFYSKSVNLLSFVCGGIGYEAIKILDKVIGVGSFLVVFGILAAFMMYYHNITSLEQITQNLPNLPKRKRYFPTDFEVVESHDEEETEQEELEETPEPEEVKPTITALKKPIPTKPGDIKFIIEDTPEEEEIVEVNKPFEPIPSSANNPQPPIIPFNIATEENLVEKFGPYDPTLELGTYQYPSIDLLSKREEVSGKVTPEELEANKDRIVETLGHFGIGISSIKATIGPTVTLYEIIPDAGVRISKIKGLEDDIALNLAALGIRIIAPMPGKGTIGIELPNKNREMVSARSVLGSKKFQDSNMDLPVVLGKTISNEIFITDLAKMPHLLMAGATGQGKSVGLNVLLASLLYKKHPAHIKFVLVDPKKVELTLFNKIERHFLAKLPNSEEAIITDTRKVVYTLNSLCIEMDNRYDLLKEAGVRNIKEYNGKFTQRQLNPEKGHKFLPYIVLVIDELADLMMTAGKEVEQPIARLAQLARAIGIHLVVATQRPSVNVITGLIKANFPARLSFRVTSKIDSRTILDTGGAEQLVGMGDMLLSMGSDMIRLQCAFLDTDEVDEVCEFIGNQRGYASAYHLPEFSGDEDSGDHNDVDLSNRDAMFDDAARVIVNAQQGSTSLIQRKMKLGYNRAGRIMDQLEAAGIVGPFEGSKAREVLITDLNALEQMLKGMG